jgi:hypothetical protein
MKLGSCIVTYNRLDYTKKCVESYLDTISTPFELVIVDNNSTDQTKDWLSLISEDEDNIHVIFNPENYFPGAACNIGWSFLTSHSTDLTHLHRSDNDVEYLPGWSDYCIRSFAAVPHMGQFGILTAEQSGWLGVEWDPQPYGDVILSFQGSANIGGNSVIPIDLWQAGVRYREIPWQPGANEDWFFSMDIKQYMPWLFVAGEKIALNQSLDQASKYPEYTEYVSDIRGYNLGLQEQLYGKKD